MSWATGRCLEGLRTALCLFLLGLGASVDVAVAAEPIAVVTELRVGRGEVRVKLSADADWMPAHLLHALRPGDQIAATADAQAVIVVVGESGPQFLSSANSPLTIGSSAATAKSERLRGALASVTRFLIGRSRKPAYESISVRAGTIELLPLAPRRSRVLPGAVTFEWSGPAPARYQVTVIGPEGPVWVMTGLTGTSVVYPQDAPPLQSGVRYVWELQAEGLAHQSIPFEILSQEEAHRIQARLNELSTETSTRYPPNTAALVESSLLLQEGLYDDARRKLLTAIAANPRDPTLHLFLAHVAAEVGLSHLAADALENAQALSKSTQH